MRSSLWTAGPLCLAVAGYAVLTGADAPALLAATGAVAGSAAIAGMRPREKPPEPSAAVTATPAPQPDVVARGRAADVDELVRRMSSSSEGAVREGEQLSAATVDLAERFTSVTGSVQSLRAAIDEIADGAGRATTIADTALERTLGAGERMETLRDAGRQIDDVTALITAITTQSRMLALNATIEAARAGPAGRGFAVVAEEVKALSAATEQAARRIAVQSRAVQDETAEASAAINHITQTIQAMTALQGVVVDAVGRQTLASGAIAAEVAAASTSSDRIADLVADRAAHLRSTYVHRAVEVAQAVLERSGGLHLGTELTSSTVTDQFSGQTRDVELPQLMIGTRPVPRNDDPAVASVFVDEVKELVGGTVTLFQRLDDEGAMLRVATNVITAQGRRAVGTFQPVRRPDGTPNPVLVEVLAGRTFSGEAQVLGRPYFTAYAPLSDSSGRVSGAVYVGLPSD